MFLGTCATGAQSVVDHSQGDGSASDGDRACVNAGEAGGSVAAEMQLGLLGKSRSPRSLPCAPPGTRTPDPLIKSQLL